MFYGRSFSLTTTHNHNHSIQLICPYFLYMVICICTVFASLLNRTTKWKTLHFSFEHFPLAYMCVYPHVYINYSRLIVGFFDFSIVRSVFYRLAKSPDWKREKKAKLSYSTTRLDSTQFNFVCCIFFHLIFCDVYELEHVRWSFHIILCVYANWKCSFTLSMPMPMPMFILLLLLLFIEIDLCE